MKKIKTSCRLVLIKIQVVTDKFRCLLYSDFIRICRIPVIILFLTFLFYYLVHRYYITEFEKSIEFSSMLLSTFATIFTLIVALLLYDRFGGRSKAIDNQLKIVLELIEFLRTNKVNIESFGEPEKLTWFIWFSKDMSLFRKVPNFKYDKNKFVILRVGKDHLIPYEILRIINDFWLPDEIRKKMEFLEFRSGTFMDEHDFDKKNYVFLNFHHENQDYFLVSESYTFEQLLTNIEDLMNTIKSWIKRNTNIKIDLNYSVKMI